MLAQIISLKCEGFPYLFLFSFWGEVGELKVTQYFFVLLVCLNTKGNLSLLTSLPAAFSKLHGLLTVSSPFTLLFYARL